MVNFERFFNLFRTGTNEYTKTNPTSYYNDFYNSTKEVYVTVSNNEFELYKTTDKLATVINKDARMLSNGIFKVKTIDTDELVDTPFSRQVLGLLRNPNPFQTQTEWIQDYQIQKNLYGNTFTYFNRAFKNSLPKTIVNLPSAHTRIVQTGKVYDQVNIEDIIERYEVETSQGVWKSFETRDVVHSQIVNPDNPLIGISPLFSLTMPISNLRGAYGFRNRIIVKNGALGILSSDSKDSSGGIPLGTTERHRIEKQYTEDYGIGDNQKSIILTPSPLKWQSMTHETDKLELFREVDNDFKAIIDGFGHNQNIYSTEDSSKFNNMNEALKMVYQDRTIPEAESLTFDLSDNLGLTEMGLKLVLDYSHLPVMQEDEKEAAETIKLRSEALATLMVNGFTLEQAQELVGFK
jgi:hypothetical protein